MRAAACALALAGLTAFAAPAFSAGSRAPVVATGQAGASGASIPPSLAKFDAASLTGQRVDASALVGQPTVLIVTPTRDAAESTRAWAEALRGRLSTKQVRVRDLIAIDLPFFMSRDDALSRARDKIPAKYHDMTWLSVDTTVESAFNIPRDAGQATVLVLDSQGDVRARASGNPSQAEVQKIVNTAQSLTSSN
ncbi:hypothetical protein [Cognatilysobacter bugurensis]|nr:hypothetical protein [Lysobacter bugurensis]